MESMSEPEQLFTSLAVVVNALHLQGGLELWAARVLKRVFVH